MSDGSNCLQVSEVKPMTNQRSSGRCWIFACLNTIRVPLAQKLTLDDLEFSQNHLFFWDKVRATINPSKMVWFCYNRGPTFQNISWKQEISDSKKELQEKWNSVSR